jgi:glycosyltransferase involved in cell wall biosynthesis
MRPRRALIVHPYRHVGGPDRFVTNLVRCLTHRGWQFWIVLSEERSLAQTLQRLGVSVVIHPSLQTLPRTLSPFGLASHALRTRTVVQSAKALIERHDIGVVHAVHETMWTLLRGLRDGSIGRVVSVHGLRFASPPWAGWLNTRMLSADADRIICVSDVVRHAFLGRHVAPRKLSLVPSSVDLGCFRPGVSGLAFRRELGVGPETPLVGTVGSVDERKGHRFFLDACARLHEQFPAARFVIVGHADSNGPAAQVEFLRQLKARAESLALNRCLSFVPTRQDVPQVMAALDILVQPSLTEAGPRAPLEAMAMERPVVGTRVEGTAEEVVDGRTGILVNSRDSRALAEAIGTLLGDPALRKQMGREGRARVEQYYSLDMTADLIEGVYEGAVMEHRH